MVTPVILERAEHPVSRRDIDPNVLKVLYRLIGAGHIAYLVGGGVRDLMMGGRPKDFDVATSAHPHQVRELFRNSRMIGRRFRLVHVFFRQQNIEVATFRRQAEQLTLDDDPLIRHDNTFGTPEEDAFRRDFTINALFYDPATFRVIDYVNGAADIKARLIRTIGDPELRMREDPVRMIRAVRFAVKLGLEIEPATLAAIERHRRDLLKASTPRLVEETFRTLTLPDADLALMLLQRLGLLELLLPLLAAHLAAAPDLETAPSVANLTRLGALIARGIDPPRPLILACLYADLHLAQQRAANPGDRFALVDALRQRGFSRAETDQMRVLLEALTLIVTRARNLRRLATRPYFNDARRLFELVAPTIGDDPAELDQFLAAPPAPPKASLRRRRRRSGRRRRPTPTALATSLPHNGGDPAMAPPPLAAAPLAAAPLPTLAEESRGLTAPDPNATE
ncbi:MAG TPA: polynucleotide adenylyltransferase PcnB [Candidatus Binataceae bacterium]|jgi:poly(A) polymerase|nr:polynucleotide adenylyltransferase PcnB [Candidatus Binataceae bacterium]